MSAAPIRAAILQILAADPTINTYLGNPPRLYDGPIDGAAFPFAIWRNWTSRPLAGVPMGLVHEGLIDLRTDQTSGKQAEEILAKMAALLNDQPLNVAGHHVILTMVLLADVLAGDDGRFYRGLLKIRILAESL